MAEINLYFNEAQISAMNSISRETFLIGGIGLGKSYFLAWQLYKALQTEGVVCGLFAPSQKVLKNSTWRQVKQAFNDFNFIQGVDYVVNKIPPAYWGVEPYTDKNYNIITTRLGSYCIKDGLDNFESQRGIELDEIFVDEFRDVKTEARDTLLGRLRGKRYKQLNKQHRIWYATTPPDDVTYLRELNQESKTKKGIEFHFGGTELNKINLGADYIDSLRNVYDDVTFQREVGGLLIMYSSNNFFCSFVYNKHVRKIQPEFNRPVYLSFDFNLDPMTCILAQHSQGQIHIIKEFVSPYRGLPVGREAISYLCELMKPYLSQFYSQAIYITGDSAGNAESVQNKKGNNSYSIIYNQLMQPLNIPKDNLQVPKTNPEHIQSRTLCNSMFERYPILLIDSDCKGLIKDFESVKVSKTGGIDKSDPNLTHLSDAYRYYINRWHSDFTKVERKALIGIN